MKYSVQVTSPGRVKILTPDAVYISLLSDWLLFDCREGPRSRLNPCGWFLLDPPYGPAKTSG